MKKTIVSMMAVLVALVLGSQEVRSAPVLDQSQTLQDSTLGIDGGVQLAMTFTGTVTGQLQKVSLWFAPPPASVSGSSQTEQITVSILGTTSGAPNTTVLWSGTFSSLAALPASATPGWLDVNISLAAPTLTAGVTYAIALSRTGSTVDRWYAEQDNVYAGGQAYTKAPLDSTWSVKTLNGGLNTNVDAAFQTFIVPEPTTVGLACVGLMAVLFRSRARYRSYS